MLDNHHKGRKPTLAHQQKHTMQSFLLFINTIQKKLVYILMKHLLQLQLTKEKTTKSGTCFTIMV